MRKKKGNQAVSNTSIASPPPPVYTQKRPNVRSAQSVQTILQSNQETNVPTKNGKQGKSSADRHESSQIICHVCILCNRKKKDLKLCRERKGIFSYRCTHHTSPSSLALLGPFERIHTYIPIFLLRIQRTGSSKRSTSLPVQRPNPSLGRDESVAIKLVGCQGRLQQKTRKKSPDPHLASKERQTG